MSVRMTIIDRAASQVMTLIDFPLRFPIPVVQGKVSTTTSLTVVLDDLGLPALPECSSIEILSVWILDPNHNRFAELGTYLP